MTPHDQAAIEALASDPQLDRLDSYVPPLRLVSALGLASNELAHSRLLAKLLNPRTHQNAKRLLREIFSRIVTNDVGEDARVSPLLEKLLASPWTRISVRTEYRHIDVFLEIQTGAVDFAIGIENKIWADERADQVGDYQDKLQRSFPRHSQIMLFMTPTGAAPKTAKDSHSTPYTWFGYRLIYDAIKALPSGCADEHALQDFAEHLKENIMGEPTIKNPILELWRKHPRALQLAVKHQPRLRDVEAEFVRLIRQRYGDRVKITTHPQRGDLREIKITFRDWTERGYPFTFILFDRDVVSPSVRVLIARDQLDEHGASLKAWAEQANERHDANLDPEFSPLDNWTYWGRVLKEESKPASAWLQERSYTSETAQEAAKAVRELVEKLEPWIDGG